jgi:hypothetical protein
MQVYVEIDQFRALLNRYKTDGTYQCVHQNTTAMSELLDAALNRKWEKLMVRRLLVVVWYLKRI